jgi:hypothetical protein
MTFLETLKRLDAEATGAKWEREPVKEYRGISEPSINHNWNNIAGIERGDKSMYGNSVVSEPRYIAYPDAELICLLRNNTKAIIELVSTVQKFVNKFGHSEDCDFENEEEDDRECTCGMEAFELALSKLKGDV